MPVHTNKRTNELSCNLFFVGELKFIIVDNNVKAKTLLEDYKNDHLKIDTIICMETPNDDVKKLAEETNAKIKTFAEIEEIGKNNLKDFVVRSEVFEQEDQQKCNHN